MSTGGLRVPGWVLELSRGDLEQAFGTTTVKRAVTYQRRGAVHGLRVSLAGELEATVYGSARYQTAVWWEGGAEPDYDDLYPDDLASDCSCPVNDLCKHAAAVVLQAQHQAGVVQGRGPARPGTWAGQHTRPEKAATPPTPPTPRPSWERALSPVLQEAQAPTAEQGTALALQIDLSTASRNYGITALQLRPLMRGASGAWIKTGISWSAIHYSSPAHLDTRHTTALRALHQATQSPAPSSSYYYTQGESVSSDGAGARLWPLLADAVAAGVTLVTGRQGAGTVRLHDPVAFSLDLTREDDGSIMLSPVVDVQDVPSPAHLLGRPGHGLAAQGGRDLHLVPLEKPLTAAVTGLIGEGRITVPAEDTDRFLGTYYPALRRGTTVTSSDGSVELPEITPPRLGLVVRFEPEHVTRLHWTFRYAVGAQVHVVPLLHRPDLGVGTLAPGETDAQVLRDPDAEEALLASLDVLDTVPALRIPVPGKGRLGVVLEPELTGWATVQLVRDLLPVLRQRDDIHLTLVGEPLDYEEIQDAPVVRVSTTDPDGYDVSQGTERGAGPQDDWFDLGIEVTVGGQPVPLPHLLQALAAGEERLLRPDGTWFTLDAPELHTLRRLVEEARSLQDHPGQGLRINRFQAGLWEELVELGVVAEQSERWQRSVGALLALEEMPHPQPPEGLRATLRSYQLDGFRWLSFLWEHELGGILADDMGLGKTVQALAAAERAREQGRLTTERPMLVVAPTSVIDTWVREAARFTPCLRVAAVTETVKRAGQPLAETIAGAHVVVTSYTLLRIEEEELSAQPWSAVVLDEAQAVKNHRSRTYQAARRLRAPLKLAITGTPLENSLMDLWALLSLGAPGLFPSPERFGQQWRRPIESGADPELLGTLRRRIRPLMLRRTKDAVAADLPPKVEQVLRVALNPAHRRVYDMHLQRERQRILGLLADVDRNRIAILAGLTRLRQLALDVHLVAKDAPAGVRPSKVDALLEQLVEVVAEGHRCLVFSQFTGFLKVVRERLAEEGIEHVYLDGRTRDRPRRIAQFTEGEAPVFVISLKAGGSGLTLTQADYVFVLDPWWNPAVEAQAVDRTHRIGQDKTVMVYRLVAEDTIEEKVVALQERKRELFDKVVDEGGLMGAPLSAADIRGLLEG